MHAHDRQLVHVAVARPAAGAVLPRQGHQGRSPISARRPALRQHPAARTSATSRPTSRVAGRGRAPAAVLVHDLGGRSAYSTAAWPRLAAASSDPRRRRPLDRRRPGRGDLSREDAGEPLVFFGGKYVGLQTLMPVHSTTRPASRIACIGVGLEVGMPRTCRRGNPACSKVLIVSSIWPARARSR